MHSFVAYIPLTLIIDPERKGPIAVSRVGSRGVLETKGGNGIVLFSSPRSALFRCLALSALAVPKLIERVTDTDQHEGPKVFIEGHCFHRRGYTAGETFLIRISREYFSPFSTK